MNLLWVALTFLGQLTLTRATLSEAPSAATQLNPPTAADNPKFPQPVPFSSLNSTNEWNLDDIEYRVLLKKSHHRSRDVTLSCKPKNSLWNDRNKASHVSQNETLHLELYNTDPFPFEWEFGLYFNAKTPNFTGPYGRKHTICRSSGPNGEILFGMAPKTSAALLCTVYQAGQLRNVTRAPGARTAPFEVLHTTRSEVDYKWADVANWTDLPYDSAFIASIPTVASYAPRNRTKGRVTGNRLYIGRVVDSSGNTVYVRTVFEDDPEVKKQSFFGYLGKFWRYFGYGKPREEDGLRRQILVATPRQSGPILNSTLQCVKMSDPEKTSLFQENVELSVKRRMPDGALVQIGPQKVYQKVETLQLEWLKRYSDPPPFFTVQSGWLGAQTWGDICRYRCVPGTSDCPTLSYQTAKGATVTRSLDGTIGYVIWSQESQEKSTIEPWLCHVAFNGTAYAGTAYDALVNRGYWLESSWSPALNRTHLAPFNGSLVLRGGVNGEEKLYIGRIERPGLQLVGQVNLTAGTLIYSDGLDGAMEEPINEQVSLLTVQPRPAVELPETEIKPLNITEYLSWWAKKEANGSNVHFVSPKSPKLEGEDSIQKIE